MSPNVVFLVCLLLTSAGTLLMPALSPARFVFGVRIGRSLDKTEPVRRARRTYYAHDLTGIALSLALVWALGMASGWIWVLAVVLPQAGAAAGYVMAHRQLARFAAPAAPPAVREADLSPDEDRLPRWALLAVPPFLIPLAGALYVQAHWSGIPARIATHYSLHGQPDGWTTRTPLHVHGFFLFGAGLLALMLAMGLVVYYGARRSAARRTGLGVMISLMYLLGAIFSGAGVWQVHPFPVWVLVAILPPYVAGLLYWNHRRVTDPKLPAESTPEDCWSFGDLYKNPDDPALFVAKRIGYGYTINFGHPYAKWVMAGFFGGMGLLVAFLFWIER